VNADRRGSECQAGGTLTPGSGLLGLFPCEAFLTTSRGCLVTGTIKSWRQRILADLDAAGAAEAGRKKPPAPLHSFLSAGESTDLYARLPAELLDGVVSDCAAPCQAMSRLHRASWD
jgi:hypothetical protein